MRLGVFLRTVAEGASRRALASLLHDLRRSGFRPYIVIGDSPGKCGATVIGSLSLSPALSNEAWLGGYTNAMATDQHGAQTVDDLPRAIRALEIPSLDVRTAMHVRFNARLQIAARAMGMGYLDCFTPLIAKDGRLARRYRGRRDGGDHHLAFRAARRTLIAGLWNTLDGQDHV